MLEQNPGGRNGRNCSGPAEKPGNVKWLRLQTMLEIFRRSSKELARLPDLVGEHSAELKQVSEQQRDFPRARALEMSPGHRVECDHALRSVSLELL